MPVPAAEALAAEGLAAAAPVVPKAAAGWAPGRALAETAPDLATSGRPGCEKSARTTFLATSSRNATRWDGRGRAERDARAAAACLQRVVSVAQTMTLSR